MKIKLILALILSLCLGLSSCSPSSEEDKSSKEKDLTAIAFIQKEGIEVEISTENIPYGKERGDTVILIQVIDTWSGMIVSGEEWIVSNSLLSLRDTVFYEDGYLRVYRNAVIRKMKYN